MRILSSPVLLAVAAVVLGLNVLAAQSATARWIASGVTVLLGLGCAVYLLFISARFRGMSRSGRVTFALLDLLIVAFCLCIYFEPVVGRWAKFLPIVLSLLVMRQFRRRIERMSAEVH